MFRRITYRDYKLDTNSPELLPSLIEIARQAADEILKVYETDFDVADKDDKSPLTAADMASHRAIVRGLEELTPDIPILSEESAAAPYEERKSWQRYWLIDPLDGTREFIKRNGEFTVNIALIENNHAVIGVVYIPVSGCCYYASPDKGAFKLDENGESAPISCRKTDTSQLAVAGSRSHGSEEQQKFMAAVGEEAEIIAIGSSLKICLVAEGKVDIYPRFGPTSEWDTAAAHAVVSAAGGRLTDTSFNTLEYNRKESILNPHFLVIADPDFDWQPYLDQALG